MRTRRPIPAVAGALAALLTVCAPAAAAPAPVAGPSPKQLVEIHFKLAEAAGVSRTGQAIEPSCHGAKRQAPETGPRRLRRTAACLVRAVRRAAGVHALRWDDRLARAARRHARDMVERDYFSHVSPGGGTLGDRLRRAGYVGVAAENLETGEFLMGSPLAAVAGWFYAPRHRAALLDARHTRVGLGVVHGMPGSERPGATYVLLLGHRGR